MKISKSFSILFVMAAFLINTTGCTQKKPSLKLYVLNCGEFYFNDLGVFVDEDQGKKKAQTNTCYLIQHPKGNFLWDTGLSDQLFGKAPSYVKGFKATMKVTNPLVGQLEQLGLKPENITHLGISHFHPDHTGNANYFTRALLLTQAEEYEAAFSAQAEKLHFNLESYQELKNNPVKKLSGDHDVFGDGSVIIKRAIGHTPGHQALFVNLPKTGPVLIVGDLYHYEENRTHRRVPKFNFDKEATLKSMENIEKFVQANNAKVWLGHDKEQTDLLKRPPEYYE